MEEEQNIEELQERERSIRQLESDIVDVNTIFKDLATMVHEQVKNLTAIRIVRVIKADCLSQLTNFLTNIVMPPC